MEVTSSGDGFVGRQAVGGMAMSSSSAGQTGQADLNFIIKGKNKFKDINLQLTKELETKWTIIEAK